VANAADGARRVHAADDEGRGKDEIFVDQADLGESGERPRSPLDQDGC